MDASAPVRRATGSRLTFIHLTHPDDIRGREIQSGIRRHIMTDVRRSRRKPPRNLTIPLGVRMPPRDGKRSPRSEEGHRDAGIAVPELDIAPPTETQFPYQSSRLNQSGILGIDLDDRVLQIVHYMKLELKGGHQTFHTVWIRMGFSDPSALNLSVSSALLLWDDRKNKMSVGRQAGNAEAAKYYFRALGQLSKRLGDPSDRTSIGVITTIIGCLCHDVHVGDWQRWSVHIAGLDRILKLRRINTNGLDDHIQVLSFWLDLVGATALDIAPRVSIPERFTTSNVAVGEDLQPAMRTLLLGIRLVFPQLSPIAQALCMMSAVTKTVNSNSYNQDFWRDAVSAVGLLGPVTHYLLSLQRPAGPIHDAPGVVIAGELVRLTCLILLSRLKALFALNAMDMVPLTRKFLDTVVAQSTNDDSSDDTGLLTEVKLCALVSSALLLPRNEAWVLVPYIRATARAKGMSGIGCAIDLAKRLIWVGILEEPRVNNLMDDFDAIISRPLN